MILLTPDLRDRLLVNGRAPDADHIPVVKFFNPLGESVWLATELDADGDTLFGLADLGEPELGSFSLREMASVCLPLGLGIERDLLFEGMVPISAWAEAARHSGSIRAASARQSMCSTRLLGQSDKARDVPRRRPDGCGGIISL